MFSEEHNTLMRRNTIEDFWKKVDKTSNPNGCWEWTGSLNRPNGYGQFGFNDKLWKSHRFSAKYIGNMDIDNLYVCHKCDNPKCVNPDHLFVGTQFDNMKDRYAKGGIGSRSIPIQTPLGIFHSIRNAAKAHNCDDKTMRKYIQSNPTEYKKL